jgi:hypothetical protein
MLLWCGEVPPRGSIRLGSLQNLQMKRALLGNCERIHREDVRKVGSSGHAPFSQMRLLGLGADGSLGQIVKVLLHDTPVRGT